MQPPIGEPVAMGYYRVQSTYPVDRLQTFALLRSSDVSIRLSIFVSVIVHGLFGANVLNEQRS